MQDSSVSIELLERAIQPIDGRRQAARRERIKLDQAVAHEIAESPEYDLLAH